MYVLICLVMVREGRAEEVRRLAAALDERQQLQAALLFNNNE